MTSPGAHSGTLECLPDCVFGAAMAHPFAHLGSRWLGLAGAGLAGLEEPEDGEDAAVVFGEGLQVQFAEDRGDVFLDRPF